MNYERHFIINNETGKTIDYESMDALVKALKRYGKKGYHPFTVMHGFFGYGMSIRKEPNFRSETPGYQAIEEVNGTTYFIHQRGMVIVE